MLKFLEKNKKNTCTIRQYMVCLTRRAEESRNEGDRSDFQKLQAAVPRVFVHSGCADNKDFPVSDLRPINVLACKTHFRPGTVQSTAIGQTITIPLLKEGEENNACEETIGDVPFGSVALSADACFAVACFS